MVHNLEMFNSTVDQNEVKFFYTERVLNIILSYFIFSK
jgi:hypothetical protein